MWLRLVITNYFAFTAKYVRDDRILHTRFPDELWDRMQNFLESLARLPFWFDRNLSTTVFGPKQNLDYWERVFETGCSPSGLSILAKPLNLGQMIQGKTPVGQLL